MSADRSMPHASLGSGLRVSVLSLAWTLVVGGISLAVGIATGSLAVAGFGAVGLLDAVGSASLVVHFTHARSRGGPSERLETITLRIVTIGLAGTALATGALSVNRLSRHAAGGTSAAAISISAISIAVLALLAWRKRQIAEDIPSPALNADSWVSAVGAALAAVATLGVALHSAGLWWADPAAATVVSLAALCLSAWLLRQHLTQ